MGKTRILHVVAGMDPKLGGVCQAVRTIVTGLNNIGIYNEIVSLDNEDAHYLSNDVIKINAVGLGKGPWRYNSDLSSWFNKNLERFDVIIIHGLWLYNGYSLRREIFKKRNTLKSLKLFIMPHGMLDPYFQNAPDRKLKAIRNWIYWKLIESKLINHANGILFTCKEELLLARETFKPYKPRKEINVSYGISDSPEYKESMSKAFQQKCSELCDHKFILYLSRIHEKKGLDLLIKAYYKILRNNKYREIPKLVIAGPGLETKFGKDLQDFVFKNSIISGNVIFTGMLEGDEKWGAFYGCDAFILPSHQENFGIAVVEALACGKPVLISNKVNIWREIEESGGGIVKSDTLEGTEGLLNEWLFISKDKQVEMNKKARNAYEIFFSEKPCINNLFKAIE